MIVVYVKHIVGCTKIGQKEYVKDILLKIDGPSTYTDALNEKYEETGSGNVSNDKYVRVLDIDKYSKTIFFLG